MDKNESELLHEQASSYYLEGDIDAALATWRRLLETSPADERAREGVELCERMSGCESESVTTEGQSPFAVGGGPAANEEAPDPASEPASEPQAPAGTSGHLDDSLDRLLELGPIDDSSALPSPGQETPQGGDADALLDFSELSDETDPPATEGFDLGEMFDASGPAETVGDKPAETSLPTPPAESEGQETTWHFGFGPPESEPDPQPPPVPEPNPSPPVAGFAADLETGEGPVFPPMAEPTRESDASTEAEPSAETDGVSGANLHRRASDLLATALSEMERGEKQSAVETLERLLILDEQNFAARSLLQKLRAEIGGAEKAPPEPVADGEPLDLAVGDPLELETTEPLVAPPPVAEAVGEEGLSGDGPDPAEEGSAVATSVGSGRRFSPPGPKIWMPAAGVVLLGAGYLIWSLFLAGAGSVEEPEVPTGQARGDKSGQAVQGSAGQTPDDAQPGSGGAEGEVKTLEQQLAETLARAEAALESANYGAAVIAFNAALDLDPENADLRKRMEAAGESYRTQTEKRARWDQAVHDFDRGDYEAALAYFYRLPEEEQTESVDQYKMFGWYNLGVLALKKRECEQAREHFREAREVGLGDAAVVEAEDLARRCTREGIAVTGTAISKLEYRKLAPTP